MYKEPVEYLKHIADECLYLLSLDQHLTKESFLKDETLKRAVARSLEIIGEAAKKVPDTFKAESSFVHWKNMAGMRDRLIHDYMGVNYHIVWDVLKSKIPALYEQVQAIINRMDT